MNMEENQEMTQEKGQVKEQKQNQVVNQKKEKTGYIYVFTNPSFKKDNWIKIGFAENVENRIKTLSGTSVPFPYEEYCRYEVPYGKNKADKLIHEIIDKFNPKLRLSGKREFFEIDPWDVYDVLKAIAEMHGRLDKLTRNESNTGEIDLSDDNDKYSTDALYPPKSDVRKIFDRFKKIILYVDKSLKEVPRSRYVAFKKDGKNLLFVFPKAGWMEVVLNAKIDQITDKNDLIYDISNRKWTASQYAFRFNGDTDEDAVKKLIEQTINLKK